MRDRRLWLALLFATALSCRAGGVAGGSAGAGKDGNGDGGAAGTSSGTAGDNGSGGGAGTATGGSNNPMAGGQAGGGAGGQAGAGGGQGGASGAGGSGTGGAAVAGCPMGVNLVCDDFEGQTVGKAPGTQWNNPRQSRATVVVDMDKAYSGSKSVKISVMAGDGADGYFSPRAMGLLPMPNFYARMMVFLDSAPSGTGLHWTWMNAGGAIGDKTGGILPFENKGIGGHPSQLQDILVARFTGGLHDCWNYSTQAVPVGRWACIEWHLDSATDTMEMWIDDKAIAAHTYSITPKGSHGCLMDQTMGKWYVGPTSTFQFGWTHYHTLAQSHTLWIDDVAIDSKRINCPAPIAGK